MSRESDIVDRMMTFMRERSTIITRYMVKARAASRSPGERLEYIDLAIIEARAILDELHTARASLLTGKAGDAA